MGGAPSIGLARRPSRRVAGTLAGAPGRLAAALGRVEAWLEAERESLPLWLPVAIGAGIASWFGLPLPADWIALMLAGGAGGLLLLTLGGGTRLGRALGIGALLVALGCGLAWSRAERVRAPVLAHTEVARLTGRVLDLEPQPARARVRLTLAVLHADPAMPPRVRIAVDDDKAVPGLAPGAIVAARARMLPPAPADVPGGYDFARAAWFLKLGASGKALDRVALVTPARNGGLLASWRALLTRHIQAAVPGSAGGVAAALVTGETGGIAQADADAMRRSGLAHLLSISGLHVSAVVAAAMLLTMRTLALSRRLALTWPLPLISALAGAGAGLGYTLLSGAEVPTVRSCVASLLVIAGIALGRDALTLRLVAAGAIVVMFAWPESVPGPSFQLSFAAVATIIALHGLPLVRRLFGKREEGLGRRFARELAALIATGLVVEAALAPIALFHFGRTGLYGAFANIVAIPLTTFLIMPAEAIALMLDLAGAGMPAWWIAGGALRLLLWIANSVGDAPGAVVMLPAMPGGAYALMVLGGLWLLLWRTRARALGFAAVLAGAAWAAASPPPDLIVTGDGRHLALRTADGRLALLRDRTGDYVQGVLGAAAGIAGEPMLLDDVPGARCGLDSCLFSVPTAHGPRVILATRSAYPLDAPALARACASSDIVVSDRRLPRTCTPRWLKADAALLETTGGLAIRLGPETLARVRTEPDAHPWIPTALPRSDARSGRTADARGRWHARWGEGRDGSAVPAGRRNARPPQ